MSGTQSKQTGSRPSSSRAAKSFSKPDAQPVATPPVQSKRASTLQSSGQPNDLQEKDEGEEPKKQDAFESTSIPETPEVPRGSIDLDNLPIELISHTDSFIESLLTTSQPAPPDIGNISRLFQDFYAQAASHIDTHINTLLLRQTREAASPAPSISSRASATSIFRSRASTNGSKERPKPTSSTSNYGEQQMITTEELAARKKARRAIEQQRGTLEEAVERRSCEGIYGKIYRHRSTQDEASDAKLRSKTAALAVVGIGLSDLGVELGDPNENPIDVSMKVEEVRHSLDGARAEIKAMYGSRYPLGKLNHLRAAHESIVDTLSQFHPSSSADEIMPMLIYTLITMPPDDLHVISDLNFIERFRWEPKLTGEAAYCLTNLEACISFLDTVDLSTLRSDESHSGPAKGSSNPGTPKFDTFPPAFTPMEGTQPSSTALKPPAPSYGTRSTSFRNRRFSDLVNTPAQAIGAASDAVRSTADQGMKNISNSLGDSYRFLMGKLRESEDSAHVGGAGASSGGDVLIPKTLEDARRLISAGPSDDTASVASSNDGSVRQLARKDDKVMSLIGGKGVAAAAPSRDHSADSTRSGQSLRKPSNVDSLKQDKDKDIITRATTPSVTGNPAIIDSVRNLGVTLNPMSRIAGIGPFRGFGRTPSSTVTPQLKTPGPSTTTAATNADITGAEGGDLATAFPDIATTLPPKLIKKIAPPSKRFMEMQNPGDIKIGEVLELLRDYRRLAGALKEMDAFK